jgi:hypothetical protein
MSDWLSDSRTGQLAMATVWKSVLSDVGSSWNVLQSDQTKFGGLIEDAAEALEKVQDKASRTHVDSVTCNTAFKALVETMRYLKNNYFNSPPRTEAELAMLELTPHNPRSDIPPPLNQVTGKTRPLGDHLLEALVEIVGDLVKDTDASDYGYRVYVGVEDHNAVIGSAGKYGKYLQAAPQSGTDFNWSFFTHRKRDVFDFDEQDRGKKVWFIVHLENAKGDRGPWGPMFWTIIP